jgi:hypothetical protein
LSQGDFLVQISFGSADDYTASILEPGVPPPTARREALRRLASSGIKTACRLQPLLPDRETEALDLLEKLADIGVSHVGVEHLKLGVERQAGTARLSKVLSGDVRAFYASVGAQRLGREWMLPADLRLPTILAMRSRTHDLGMSFGAADTDLLPLSDGLCCCSGADMLLDSGVPFQFNYLGAVRNAGPGGRVTFASLNGLWAPGGSIARMVNSRSRVKRPDGRSASIADYIKANWNGRRNGCSPQMFYGVQPTGDVDEDGLRVYRVSGALNGMLRADPPRRNGVSPAVMS